MDFAVNVHCVLRDALIVTIIVKNVEQYQSSTREPERWSSLDLMFYIKYSSLHILKRERERVNVDIHTV